MNPSFVSLVDLVRARAENAPDSLAFRFLVNGSDQEELLTYASLLDDASAVGAALRSRGAAGERVLILCPSGLDYLRAFFGCLVAGAIAIPTYPPRPNRSMRRLAAIRDDSGARFAIVAADAPRIHVGDGVETLSMDKLREPAPLRTWPKPSTPAMLQYTSGSTGHPKGVLLTHAQLLANQEMIQSAFRHDASSVFVTWLPLFHDMGLIGSILQPLYCGIPCVLMAPLQFFQRPIKWLRAISRFRGTTSGAPNFAYEHCVRRITEEEKHGLDLSSWEIAFNGAEPVRLSTMRRFSEAFEAHGFRRRAFYPCYGLAEAALIVAGGMRLAGPAEDAYGRTSCGRALQGSELIVVDPVRGERLPDGEEGELWVRSPSVAAGYWQKPAETADIFGATLADGSGPYLQTGDLAILREGEVFITGRAKELLIFRGANYHPEDIEYAASARAAEGWFPPTAAFSVDVDRDPKLVVVQEVAREHAADGERQIAAIRHAVAEECDLECWTVVLVRSGSLPLTTSGKIERASCRATFLSGALREIQRSVALEDPVLDTGDDPVRHMRAMVADRLGVSVEEIPVGEPLIHLGLDSVGAQHVLHHLESRFGIEATLEEFFNGASIESLLAPVGHRPCAIAPPLAPGPPTCTPTSLQRAMWFFEEAFPANAAYVIERTLVSDRPLDVGRVAHARAALFKHLPWLRCAFAVQGGELASRTDEAPAERMWPTNGCEIDADLRRLRFRVHHALADLPSFMQLLQDFICLYDGTPLPVRAHDAIDSGAEESEWLHSTDAAAQLQYWRHTLEGAPSALHLAPGRRSPPHADFSAARQTFSLSTSLMMKVRDRARISRTTPFVVLLAAWKVLLSKYSGERDIVVGCPFPTRTRRQPAAGCQVNPVALRSRVDHNETLEDFLRQVHIVTANGIRHARYPFAEVVARLLPNRDRSHMPFFNVMFTYFDVGLDATGLSELALGIDGPPCHLGSMTLRAADSPPRHGYSDLDLAFAPTKNAAHAALTFRTDLFDTEAARVIASDYVDLIGRIIAISPRAAVAEVLEPSRTAMPSLPTPEPRDILTRFEACALSDPEATAVLDANGHVTYRELVDRVDRLAARLARLGVDVERTVGVCLPRDIDSVVALLAVLKAHGVYLPLDPEQPAARLQELARRSGMHVVITRRSDLLPLVAAVLPHEPMRDDAQPDITFAPPERDSLAYMMSTSGSTGEPKLVQVTHEALANAIGALAIRPGFGRMDRFLATTTTTFDVSLAELLLPLTTGGSLAIAEPTLLLDPDAFALELGRTRATHAQATPSGWRTLIENGWQGSRGTTLWTVGESLSPQLARRMLARGRRVWNLYGPTEATIYATAHDVCWADVQEGSLVPIGTPLPNVTASLDGADDEGELLLGGACVGRGYRGDSRATAARFGAADNGRSYRTGDRVRSIGGRLFFVQRLDRQVKIRGMRVEPGELEAVLLKQPGVRDAAVRVETGRDGLQELVAFVETASAGDIEFGLLRALRTSVPKELVPARVVALASFPRTTNGKLAREALVSNPTPAVTREAFAPAARAGRQETAIAEAWAVVLRLDQPPRDANFFEVGGHSLLLPRLQHELRTRLDQRVSIGELLEYPTIRMLAQHLDGEDRQQNATHPRDVGRLSLRRGRLGDLTL